MVTKDFLINTFVILFVAFGIFITIVHFYRRSKMPDKFIWHMDFGGIDVIATLIYFFREMKARKERKRKKKETNNKNI